MGFFSKLKTLWNTEDGRYSLFSSVRNFGFADGRNINKLLHFNDISLYLNRGIDKRAEKVSEIQFQLKKRGTNEIIEENNKDAKKWLDLLNRPSKKMTGKQFWKLAQTYKDVTGACFILKVTEEAELFKPENVTELKLLPPQFVTVNFNTEGDIENFTYKPEKGASATYTKDQVIYAYTPDTANPLKPASILKAGVRNIETELQLVEYQAKVLKNGGKLEGVFKFDKALNKDQMLTLKESYKEEYAAAQKSGIPLFLGGGAEYKNVSLNPSELSYLESRGASIKDICAITGVPLAILAITSGETFSNAEASIAIFLRETIKPQMTELNDILDWQLIPDGFDLTFVDPTPEDVDRKIKIAKAGYETDSLTINERREVLGYGEFEDEAADDIMVSFNKSPLSQKTAPAPTKSLKKKTFTHPLADKDFRKKYGEVQSKRLDAKETKMVATMRQYFSGQEARLIESLEGKKQFKKKGLLDEIFNYRLEVNIASGSVLPLLRSFLAEAGKDATDLVEYAVGFNMTSQIEKWLDDRANLFSEQITETTFKDLKRQFEESFEAGETRQELISRIKDVYSGYDDNRAKTIARTEVHGAVQKGTYEGYAQAGVPTKIWVWAPGVSGGIRHDHLNMDGVEVPINQDFQLPSGATCQFPGNTGVAEEDINCSCSV